MAENYIGFKLTPEMRAGIITRAEADGVSASEWIRGVIEQALVGEVPSVDEGYRQARRLATQMATEIIRRATRSAVEAIPETVDEFQAAIMNEPPDY